MTKRCARALLVALLWLGAGCRSITEIVVRVDTLVPAGASFTVPPAASATLAEVCFRVEGLGFGEAIESPIPEPVLKESVKLRTTGADGACLPIELGVVARGDWTDRDFGIEVRGQSDCSVPDAPYLYARAIARFTPEQVTLLSLQLEPECPTRCRPEERCDYSKSAPMCVPIALGEPLSPYAPAAARCP